MRAGGPGKPLLPSLYTMPGTPRSAGLRAGLTGVWAQSARTSAVNKECCDEPTEDCSDGEPAVRTTLACQCRVVRRATE